MKHSITVLSNTLGIKYLNAISVRAIRASGIKQPFITSVSALICASFLTLSTLSISTTPVQAQQTLNDFSVLPESLVGNISANPNILIILDNSGSMGRFRAREQTIPQFDELGEPLPPLVISTREGDRYVRDAFTDTQYIRNQTNWDASSAMSNSFQVRQAMLNIINDPTFTGRVNVGLMAFGTEECTYDPADNNAFDPDVASAIDHTNLLYECKDSNGNIIGDPVRRREFNRSTNGLGLLRANLANLEGEHKEKLLRLLALEPTPYVNEPGQRNVGTEGVGGLDTVIFGTPDADSGIVGGGSPVSTSNPLHGVVHPFLLPNPADRVINGNEFPILSSPDNAYSNFTPLSGSIDSAFRYLLRNDAAVSELASLDDNFKNGLVGREYNLVDTALQYPTADQCEGDLIVILLTDGVASQLAPSNLDTGIGGSSSQRADSPASVAAVASAARLHSRGFTDPDDDESTVELFVIGFNLNGQGEISANNIANAGSGGTRTEAISANSPDEVEQAFRDIFSTALNQGGSRSSLSVVAAADSALGSFMQPGFVPLMSESIGTGDEAEQLQISWTGELSNFFIDQFGNFREDTNANNQLDDDDLGFIIEFDDDTELAHITTFMVDTTDGSAIPGSAVGIANTATVTGPVTDINRLPDTAFDVFIQIEDLTPIWSATERLNALADDEPSISRNRTYTQLPGVDGGRHILTSLDGVTAMPFVWSNSENSGDRIDPTEIGLFDIPLPASATTAERNAATEDLINFIRGFEGNDNFRSRTLPNGSSPAKSYLLGDIIHSTPVQVEAPILEQNSAPVIASFRPYQEHYIDRRRVTYVGANDGMLHAFNGGFWDGLDEDDVDTDGERRTVSVSREPESGSATNFELGDEIWAYIPQAVLPHLKFLSDPNYLADTHVAYVDGSIRAYEAKIFDGISGNCDVGLSADAEAPSSCRYVNGWGTVLVVGLRLGGAPYTGDLDNNPATPDQTTATSFLVFDVTDPEQPPVLIDEITNPGFNLGTATPALVRTSVEVEDDSVDIEYALVFGSGPKNLQTATISDGDTPELFVYELEGRSATQVGGANNVAGNPINSFIGGINTADWNGDDEDDAIYFGTVGGTNALPTGQLYRGELESTTIDTTQLVDAKGAVTETPTIPADQLTRENKYILFGTGRSLVPDDLRTRYNSPNVFAGVIEDIESIDSDSVTFGDDEIAASLDDGSAILPTNIATNTNSSLLTNVLGNPVSGDTRGELLLKFGNDDDDRYQGWVFTLPLEPRRTARMSAMPFTLEELVFFTDFEPQLLEEARAEAEAADDDDDDVMTAAICLPPGTGFLTILDYRIGFVPAEERFLLSEDVLLPPAERSNADAPNRFEVSGSLLAGGSVLNLGPDENGNANFRIKLPGGDQDVKELVGLLLPPSSDSGRSAWREIPIPDSVVIPTP